MPLISIVMPAYNSALYIEQAIVSVLNQTYRNFELIICDDSSMDETAEIIGRYSKIDLRIVPVNNFFRKGAAGARNSCLEIAKGAYICFLDSDDYWDEQKLEKQLNFMSSNKLDFSYSNYYMFEEGSKKILYARPFVDFNALTYTCDIGCLTVMLTRKIIGNIRFPYLPKEDYAFWLLILQQGIVATNTGDITAYYRKQKTSLSSNKFKEIFRQYQVLAKLTNFNKFQISLRLLSYIYHALIKHMT